MSYVWPRRATGKLVQSPGGPIQGSDYQTTGRSAQPPFPDVGDAVAFPALGITNQEKWAEYPRAWEGGGLYLRPYAAADGTVYLVASRVRSYPEYPEKPNCRYYVETLHAAHPVATLDFSSLFQLPDRLVPVSLTEVDKAFPPLELDGERAAPLPRGWFEHSRAMLVAVVAGTPLVAHEYALPADEFFARALRAVACLPGTIRWRVAVAAGVYAVPPADKAGIRYALALSFQSPGPAGPAGDAGEAYASWFEEATGAGDRCETVQDIMTVVESRFPALTGWDALPPSEGWEVAVKALAEIQQFEILRAFVRTGDGPAPRFDGFRHLRADVLDLAAASLDAPEAVRDTLLTGVAGPDWHEAWQRFASRPGTEPTRMAAVGQVLGTLSPLDPAKIARVLDAESFEMPSRLHGDIKSRLSSALGAATAGSELAPWQGLLRRAFATRSPGWFASWAEANASQLVWRAIRLRFLAEGMDVTTSWDPEGFPGAPAAVRAILRGQQPKDSDFGKLLDFGKRPGGLAAADVAAAQRLIQELGPTRPQAAIRLALAVNHDTWLSDRTRPEVAKEADEGWARAVAAVAESAPQVDPRVAGLVMSVWTRLTRDERKRVLPRLQNDLGSLASILFGDHPEATNRPVAPWVWPIVGRLCEADRRMRRDVLEAASRRPGLVTQEFREHLLDPILSRDDLGTLDVDSPTLRFALAVRDGGATGYPAAQGAELEAARLWLPALEGLELRRRAAPVLRRLDQFPIAVLYRRFLDPFPPEAEGTFWRDWIRMIHTDQRARYLDYVKEAGAEKLAFWRFAAGWGRIDDRLSSREIAIVHKHGLAEDYLHAALWHGAPLEPVGSIQFDQRTIAAVCKNPDECRALYRRFRDIKGWTDPDAFWEHCLDQMPWAELQDLRSEIGRRTLEKALHIIANIFFVSSDSIGGWHRLALEIYQSSGEAARRRLRDAILDPNR